MTNHLGYGRGGVPAAAAGDGRNGSSAKPVLGAAGQVVVAVPRDRHGTFTPQLLAKGQRRFDGFDEKLIALSAAGADGVGDSGAAAGTAVSDRVR